MDLPIPLTTTKTNNSDQSIGFRPITFTSYTVHLPENNIFSHTYVNFNKVNAVVGFAAWTASVSKVTQLAEAWRAVGPPAFFIGETMDLIALSNSTISPQKAGENLIYGGIGFTDAAPLSAAYFFLDSFYQGGAEGALHDRGHMKIVLSIIVMTHQDQKMLTLD